MRQPLQGGGGGLPAPPRSSASSFPCLSSIAADRLPPPLSAVLQLDSHCRRERDAEYQPHSPPWPSVRRRTTPLHTARCGRLLPRRPLPPLARPHRSREPTAQGATQHCWRSSSFAGHDPPLSPLRNTQILQMQIQVTLGTVFVRLHSRSQLI
jgi:hypothetical protein